MRTIRKSYSNRLAALLFSIALLNAPALSSTAYAHDGNGKQETGSHCDHTPLSQAQMDLLHTTMQEVHSDNKAVFDDMGNLRRQRQDILGAKNFDRDSFMSIEMKMQENRDQLSRARAEAFASIADKFSPEERQHVGNMLGHRHHHPHGEWMHGAGNEKVTQPRQAPGDADQGGAPQPDAGK